MADQHSAPGLMAPDDSAAIPGAPPHFFAGGGEMGRRIRGHDWAGNALGTIETWPRALRTALRIMLSSRYAMWLAWGRDLTFFCNDAYLPTLGQKQGWLGASAKTVWAEIWPDIGPRIERVLRTGEATWDEGLLLFLERSGYPEETYHTFSYSPAPEDDAGIGGMLCVVAEETERVIGERRLATLRDLASALAAARGEAAVRAAAETGLGRNQKDLPFTLLYMFEADGAARLAAATGVPADHPLSRPDAGGIFWPSADRSPAAGLIEIENLDTIVARVGGAIPTGGAWRVAPRKAASLPILGQGQGTPIGFLVAGLNPFRPLDDDYAGFLHLVAGQVAAGLANARAFAEERRRADALAELDRAKTAFFSNVSHEFRTPLTLMLAPLDDALNDPFYDTLPDLQRERLVVAHRNSMRLLKLVNTLLDFSRIEAGRANAAYQATDLAAFTSGIAAGFRSAIERAGLSLTIANDTAVEPVYVDREMWEKIVLNLLSNAFKFTFEGGIEVRVARTAVGAALTVRDSGVGIPPGELPRLFERFHRIEGQKSRSFEGSGIGLALVAELVRLHGGTIDVASEPGHGTAFTVTVPFGTAHLPADRIGGSGDLVPDHARIDAYVEEALGWLPDHGAIIDAAIGTAAAANGTDIADRARPTILLVDDNSDMRGYVQRLLEQRYKVLAVGDGRAALESIRRARPDLVLSDVMMPVLDGFGLLRAVREDPALRDLPVILLSARAGEEARAEGLDAGADDYLTKPFSARELLARVGANLGMARVREEAAAALRARTMELETVLDTVPVGVWFTYDRDGRHVQGNKTAARLLRVAEGQNPSLSAPEGERPSHYRFFDAEHEPPVGRLPLHRAATGEVLTGQELKIVFDDGTSAVLLFQARPLLDPAGTIVGTIAAAIDVTERKQAEDALLRLNDALEDLVAERTRALLEANERLKAEMAERERAEENLRQSQKMEAVGQLTGGLAHDFNNLLTGIIGSLELLQTRAAQGRIADLGRYIAAARGACDRAASLTHRLLAFSRRQTLQPKTVSANRLIAGMEELIRRTIGPAIHLEVVKAVGLWNTLCDPNQLENVLLNLCINARDAMPDGGRLTIETENCHLDARTARQRDLEPGQYIGVYVTDTGVGMPPDVLTRAFDPFFTTKPLGQGTGLGLSMTYGFARQSGGQARIYSEVGQGTSVKLYLPRHHGHDEPDEEIVSEPDGVPRAGAHETVLVVDDEPTVRMLVTEVLDDLGYVAIEAGDGAAGLRVLQSDARVDLLVTDVGLPGGMNGRQLADAGRVHRPGLKVLFITGYAENAVFGNGILEPSMQVIAKPFSMDVLATRIRVMISAV
jgi:signal transduction histidine kinase/PleD family two-component response regulator